MKPVDQPDGCVKDCHEVLPTVILPNGGTIDTERWLWVRERNADTEYPRDPLRL